MAGKKEAYSYTIPLWSASYLINADASALEDFEIEECEEFADEVRKAHGNANFIAVNDYESFFAMPDFGNLFSNCIEVVIIES